MLTRIIGVGLARIPRARRGFSPRTSSIRSSCMLSQHRPPPEPSPSAKRRIAPCPFLASWGSARTRVLALPALQAQPAATKREFLPTRTQQTGGNDHLQRACACEFLNVYHWIFLECCFLLSEPGVSRFRLFLKLYPSAASC